MDKLQSNTNFYLNQEPDVIDDTADFDETEDNDERNLFDDLF